MGAQEIFPSPEELLHWLGTQAGKKDSLIIELLCSKLKFVF